MTNKEAKEPGEGQGPARKPRGMGGIILILALLMALFVVVSSSSRDGQNSLHAFYSHLLNSRLSKITLSDGTASAQVKTPKGPQPIEVVVRDFLRFGEINYELFSTLSVTTMDTQLYPDPAVATRRFLDDVKEKRVLVRQAFFTNEVAPKATTAQATSSEEQVRKPGAYLTALLYRGSSVHYVRLDPQIGRAHV